MKKILLSLNLLALLAGVVLLATLWWTTPKTAFVDLAQLYENFNGKKELTNRLSHFENQQKATMDSLAMEIRSLQSQMPVASGQAVLASLNEKQMQYRNLQQQFAEQYQMQDQQFAEAVWKQINQYVLEYGEQQGYDYIYGTAGNGSLMYGSESRNITPQVLNFINEQYEGI
ncbi:MAG: OmpH family outer membrane protein [Bacteroidota bacterium]